MNGLSQLIGIERSKLARILRLLTAKGMFTEGKYICTSFWCASPNLQSVDRDIFANNRLSLVIKSTCKSGYYLPTVGSGTSRGASVLFDALCDPEYGASHNPGKTALHYAMRQNGVVLSNVFDVLEVDVSHRSHLRKIWFFMSLIFQEEKNKVHSEALSMTYPKLFHRGSKWPWMALEKPWAHFQFCIVSNGVVSSFTYSSCPEYPWDEVSTVCDVGASIGTFSIPLAKAYPHLKITNQDLERVVAQAEDVSVWAPILTCASDSLEHRHGKGKPPRLLKNSVSILCL